METLFLTKGFLSDMFYLKDSKGFTIGSFPKKETAVKFCKEMGYKLRDDTGKKIEWLA